MEHRIDPQRIHHAWDNTLEPSLRIGSGDSVHYELLMASHHGAMGIAPDLMEGTRIAVAGMVDWIVAEHGLSSEDAYMLCSLAGDLKILEVVDAGMWNVGLTLPRSVFTEPGA